MPFGVFGQKPLPCLNDMEGALMCLVSENDFHKLMARTYQFYNDFLIKKIVVLIL